MVFVTPRYRNQLYWASDVTDVSGLVYKVFMRTNPLGIKHDIYLRMDLCEWTPVWWSYEVSQDAIE